MQLGAVVLSTVRSMTSSMLMHLVPHNVLLAALLEYSRINRD